MQMQADIDDKIKTDAGYKHHRANVVDEMNQRHKLVMNPNNTPVANFLTGPSSSIWDRRRHRRRSTCRRRRWWRIR